MGENSDAKKTEAASRSSLEVECLRTYLKSAFSVLFVTHVLERLR